MQFRRAHHSAARRPESEGSGRVGDLDAWAGALLNRTAPPSPTSVIFHEMDEAVRIRKQEYDIRPEDLRRFPIWEYALDEETTPGQDELTLRPRPDLDLADA